MSEINAELKATQLRIQVLERNLRDAEEANRRLAKQVIKADQRVSDLNGEVLRLGLQLKHHLQLQAERDALSAKLAELEGQAPALYVQSDHVRHAKHSPFLGRICQQPFDGISQIAYCARPVPAEESFITVTTDDTGRCVMVSRQDEDHRILSVIWEADGKAAEQPVNARLLAAARAVVARWETPLWKDAPATAGFIYELRDALAESAPKAVRLTDEEVVDLFAVWNMTDGASHADLMLSVETAVLRKNGIEVAE